MIKKEKCLYFFVLFRMFIYEVDFVYINILLYIRDFEFNVVIFKFIYKKFDYNFKKLFCYDIFRRV